MDKVKQWENKIEYNKEVTKFYDKFTKEALSDLFMIEFPMLQEITKLFNNNLKWKKWLDFWCWLWQLADKFQKVWATMTWVDISESQINVAKAQFPNIKFINNLEKIPNDSLDFIICKFSLCEMNTDEYYHVLKKFKKKLKKNGYLIIWDHNRDVCGGKETMCEKYANIDNKKPWEKVDAILKTPWSKFNEDNMEKNKDYVVITDHYRPNKWIKESLRSTWYSNIEITPSHCPEYPTRVPLDEKETPVYKITTAKAA